MAGKQPITAIRKSVKHIDVSDSSTEYTLETYYIAAERRIRGTPHIPARMTGGTWNIPVGSRVRYVPVP